jgi:dolichyl-phosphate-mannose--protein O-mannosyl transferase
MDRLGQKLLSKTHAFCVHRMSEAALPEPPHSSDSEDEGASEPALDPSRISARPAPKELPSIPAPLIIPFNWNGFDALFMMVLVFFGIFTRFWMIHNPRHMVFGEEMHLHMVNSLINGSFFIGPDPPLAALFFASIATAAHYSPYFFPRLAADFEYSDMQYVTMRSIPAFFSAIVVPLSFLIVRAFGGTRLAGIAGGCFALFDFLLISLGRYAFTDGFVQFFVAVTVFATALTRHFRPRSHPWWALVFLQAAFLAFSLSSTLSAFGLWVFVMVWHINVPSALILNALLPLAVLVVTFAAQVCQMPLHSQYDKVLGPTFGPLLVHSLKEYHLARGTILRRAFEHIRIMLDLPRDGRGYDQAWWRWPVMAGSWNLLWRDRNHAVAAFGNLVVWWPLTGALLLLLAQIAIARKIRKSAHYLAIGWAASLVYFTVGRARRGVCEYEIALMFGIWALPLFVDAEASDVVAGFTLAAMIGGAGFLFVAWSPLLYGSDGVFQLPYFAK